ncbi:MAG: glycosyltransferase [Deltaproteobacteria bacterium]|nr:glycosyltransferase [Deltaproteobacteria bacterium]
MSRKITLLSTYDRQGGAARAAFRLHRGLADLGWDSRMLVRHRTVSDPAVTACPAAAAPEDKTPAQLWQERVAALYWGSRRAPGARGDLYFPYPGLDVTGRPEIVAAEVLNLHWVQGFLSPVSVAGLLGLGQPVIWTLHDHQAFTGGCPYPGDCRKFTTDCAACPLVAQDPMVASDPLDLTARVLADKLALWSAPPPVVVAPSRWLAGRARASLVFRDARVEAIPNALDCQVFRPQPKEAAKAALNLPPDALTILYGADNLADPRKGLDLLLAALARAGDDPAWRALAAAGRLVVLAFGFGSDPPPGLGLPFRALGHLPAEADLARAYAAAEVFVLPTREDNLPNTVLEALACGTPVLATAVGGVPEMVTPGVNGLLAPPEDAAGLAAGLVDILAQSAAARRAEMGRAARADAVARFDLPVQARAYVALAEELLAAAPAPARKSTPRPAGSPASPGVWDTRTGPAVAQVADRLALATLAEAARALARATDSPPRPLAPPLMLGPEEPQAALALRPAAGFRHPEGPYPAWHLPAGVCWLVEPRGTFRVEVPRPGPHEIIIRCRVMQPLAAARLYYRGELLTAARVPATGQGRDALLTARAELAAGVTELELRLTADHPEERRLWLLVLTAEAVPLAGPGAAGLYGRAGYLDETTARLEATVAGLRRRVAARDLALRSRNGEAAALTPGLESPRVEAFVVARQMGRDLPDLALERLFSWGGELTRVVALDPAPADRPAVYLLAAAGAAVTVLRSGGEDLAAWRELGCRAEALGLGPWLARGEPTELLAYDGVWLGGGQDPEEARLLKGRLAPGARLLWREAGPAPARLPGGWPAAAEAAHGLARAAAPAAWQDPGRPVSLYDPPAWPGPAPGWRLPERTPTGRPWPRISVVTATLNQGRFLEDALLSVLHQGYPNLQYLVLDGGSTDETPAILERYRGHLAYCRSGPDGGQAAALAEGLARADGDILAWLNSDDVYQPGALLRVALAFDAWGPDMVAGGCGLWRTGEARPHEVHHPALPLGRVCPLPLDRLLDLDGAWLQGDFFYQPEVFWSREIWRRAGARLAEDLYFSMDYELWVRLARAGARILHLPDTLVRYRVHPEQKTFGADLPYLPELRRVNAALRRHGGAA